MQASVHYVVGVAEDFREFGDGVGFAEGVKRAGVISELASALVVEENFAFPDGIFGADGLNKVVREDFSICSAMFIFS